MTIPRPIHHVGNVGTVFRRRLKDQDGDPVDLTQSTSITFRFAVPADSGNPASSLDRVGAIEGAATDGVVVYTTIAGDLSVPGRWQVQVFVNFSGGRSFAAEATEFMVEARIPAP